LGLAVALGAIAFAVVLAQPPAPQQPPTFRTEANYVRVDAYPTKDEAPVTDLTQSDFEILESGTPQKIEQFERIVIQSAGPQDTRMEPNTVRESLAMAQASRARLVVLFLDTYHVEVDGSRRIRKPLVDALDKLIGPDDLVAVMTPEMSATDITFARKTTTIDGILTRYWHWGDRDKMNLVDPVDRAYIECYPNVPPNADCADQNGIAAEMLDRRHEKLVLDALEDLVGYLRGVREERKRFSRSAMDGCCFVRTKRWPVRSNAKACRPGRRCRSTQGRAGSRPRIRTMAPPQAGSARPIGCAWRSSTTIGNSAIFSMPRIAPTHRSIRSIREGLPCSTPS
jgi:hypothetical protein